MFRLLRRSVEVLRSDGVFELYQRAINYIEQYMWELVDNHQLAGFILTPLMGILYKRIIFKTRNSYVRITWRKNVFGKRTFHFPNFRHYNQLKPEIHPGYFSNDLVPVDTSDIVFEVGGFVGVTATTAAKSASKVIVIEPSPRNLYCLRRNIEQENIELYNFAAWNCRNELTLNLGLQSGNDSLIDPDDRLSGQVTVQADTIYNIVSELGLDEINFLKIEAEGAEPEVIEGTSGLEIDKIIVNCSEERNGESPIDKVEELLLENGYSIVSYDQPVAYAKLD